MNHPGKILKLNLAESALLFLLGLTFLHTPANAQGNMLLGPQQSLIQSNLHINPSFIPQGKLTVSLPPLLLPFPGPGFGFSMSSSAFALSEVIKPGPNGQTLVDTRALVEHANSMNTISASFQADMLSAGYFLKGKHFLSLRISNRAEIDWEYSRDMIRLLIEGNGANGILGEELSPHFYLGGMHYTSVGIGYSTVLKEGRLKAGIRLQYLSGQEHIETRKSGVKLFTDAGDFTLRASTDILIRTSGLHNGAFQGAQKPFSSAYLFGTGNNGAGLDVGFSYSINDRWHVAAAANEIGFIRWENDVRTYSSKENGASVDFQGVDLNEYQDESITVQEAFEELTDSLAARFELEEGSTSYTSMLNIRAVASATYLINKNHSASLFIQNTLYDQRVHPDISLSYSFSSGKWFRSSLAWSYTDRTARNLGVFLSAQAGAFQWYLCSDNVLGIVFYDRYSGLPVPAYARHASIRAGFNLILGRADASQ